MNASPERDILNVDEAAALLGVSVKTFTRALRTENLPARKIGREWKFSRSALVGWVGDGRSMDFYRESSESSPRSADDGGANNRRTAGWQIELD